MANACLTYLSFEVYEIQSRFGSIQQEAGQLPFHLICLAILGDHVHEAGSDLMVQMTAFQLIDDSYRVVAYVQAAWFTDRGSTSCDVRWGGVADGLHVCAWFGLSTIIAALDQEDLDVDVQETTYRQTPLMYACRAGHIEVVQQLLDLDASVNKVSERGRTPLFEAII